MTNSQSERPWQLLIAEDSPEDLELCLRELKKSDIPFVADVVSTRDEFTAKLGEKNVDIVISDFRMKGWTGLDALETVKTGSPETPLILLTGTLGDQLAVECIKKGVTDYVLKDQIGRLPLALHRAKDERQLRDAEKRAVEALRESEARYRGLVDNAPYGIYWEKLDGTLVYANRALAQMLGFDAVEEFLAIETTAALYCNPASRLQVQESYLKEQRVDSLVDWKRKDGRAVTVRINGRYATDLDRSSPCLEVMVEDVTERLALEAQLLQSRKFEAIGQLAGGIAHDFNNMIGAILGWADMGIEETDSASRLHRHFEKVRHQAERAGALTRQLLAFARRQILEPRDIDFNQAVTETLNLLEKVLGSNIEIKCTLASGLPVVRADPTQLEQVLMNLCINARDAMPEGGLLIVETSKASLDEESCKVQPLAHPGNYVMLCVTDTGIGMDSATLDRIFEPFFTTKELGKGTGLGLATVYGIVRQHGGFVHVYSEPQMGTTFRVYVPVSSAAIPSQTKPIEEPEVEGGTETILIAEDHDGLRQLASETLTKLGYNVIAAADGEDAVRAFRAHGDRVQLAVLDVVLPKLNGPEVYSRVAAERPEIPVIFATGYSADFALLQKVQQQGLPMLQKPYTARELARKVRETLDRHPSPRLS
jgi:two-component system, cell cycle sensor histidine kinase and response regulator CckA